MPRVRQALENLSQRELVDVIERVSEILFWDSDSDQWNIDKVWDEEFLEMIAGQLPASVLSAISGRPVEELMDDDDEGGFRFR